MAKLVIKENGSEKTVELLAPVMTFGRAPENTVILQDREFSRRHFQIEKTDQGFKLVDLESRNGTRVNERVVNQALLNPGDLVQVGKTVIQFLGDGIAPPAPPPPPSPPPVEVPRESEVRRRGSATTSVDKIRGVQRARASSEAAKETQTLKIIGGIAAGFLGVLVLLIIVGAVARGRGNPEEPIKPPVQGDRRETPQEDRDEAALFAQIVELQKALDGNPGRVVEKCDAYLAKYSDRRNASEVRKIRSVAELKRDSAVKSDLARVQSEAENHRREGRYMDALQSVRRALDNPQLTRFNVELSELKNRILQEANTHYGTQIKRGFSLMDDKKYDEARAHFERLRRELTGVPEFDAKLKAVEEALEKLR